MHKADLGDEAINEIGGSQINQWALELAHRIQVSPTAADCHIGGGEAKKDRAQLAPRTQVP